MEYIYLKKCKHTKIDLNCFSIDRFKKGKAKDSSGVQAEQLKIAVTRRRKNQKNLQRNHTTRRLHAEELAQDSYPSHLQERRQRKCR